MSGNLHGEFWIQTLSGQKFDFGNPNPKDISLSDITHALALSNRFSGHTKQPWSIAQHTLLCYALLQANGRKTTARLRLGVLLHDAHEAYVGDMASPLKWALRGEAGARSAYDDIEDRAAAAVQQRFGLTPTPEEVAVIRHVDLQALWLEKETLLAPSKFEWGIPFPEMPKGDFKVCFRKRRWMDVRSELHTLITNTTKAMKAAAA